MDATREVPEEDHHPSKRPKINQSEDLLSLIAHHAVAELRPTTLGLVKRLDPEIRQTLVTCILQQDYKTESHEFLVALIAEVVLGAPLSHQTVENLPAVYELLLHTDAPYATTVMAELINLLLPRTIIQSNLVQALMHAPDFHAVPTEHANARYVMLLAVCRKVQTSDVWKDFLEHTGEIVRFLLLSPRYAKVWFEFCKALCARLQTACIFLQMLTDEMQHTHLRERLVSLYTTTLDANNHCVCCVQHMHAMLTEFAVEEDDPLFAGLFDRISRHLGESQPCSPEQISWMVRIMQSYHMRHLECNIIANGLHEKLLGAACESLTLWAPVCESHDVPELLKLATHTVAQTLIQPDVTKTQDAVGAAWAFFRAGCDSGDRAFREAVDHCIEALSKMALATDPKVVHVHALLAVMVPSYCEPEYITKQNLIHIFLTLAIHNQQFDYTLLLDTLFTVMQSAHRNVQEVNFKRALGVFLHEQVLPVNFYALLSNMASKMDRSFVVGHNLVRLVDVRARQRGELNKAHRFLRALIDQVRPPLGRGFSSPVA